MIFPWSGVLFSRDRDALKIFELFRPNLLLWEETEIGGIGGGQGTGQGDQ